MFNSIPSVSICASNATFNSDVNNNDTFKQLILYVSKALHLKQTLFYVPKKGFSKVQLTYLLSDYHTFIPKMKCNTFRSIQTLCLCL